MEVTVRKQGAREIINLLTTEVIIPYLKRGRSLTLTFSGPLGAGKTQSIKWLAQSLGIRQPLRSPTFTLWQTYAFSSGRRRYTLHHLDLYRLDQPREIFKLSLRTTLRQPGNLIVIEWGERLHRWLPKPWLNVKLERTVGTNRRLTIISHV